MYHVDMIQKALKARSISWDFKGRTDALNPRNAKYINESIQNEVLGCIAEMGTAAIFKDIK